MVHLVLKDMLIQKKNFLYALLFSFAMHFAFSQSFQDYIYIMGAGMITYLFVITANATEEKSNSEIMINCLPILRNSIVKAKYVSALVFAIIGLSMLTLIGAVLRVLPLFPGTIRLVNGFDILFIILFVMLAVTFYFPFYFKFGYTAIRMGSIFLFFALLFLPRILMEQYSAGNLSIIERLFYKLSGLYSGLPVIAIGIIILILFLISSKLSQRLYSAKDL